eukprot:6186112-Pleurochrysis_carterae.AAC.9
MSRALSSAPLLALNWLNASCARTPTTRREPERLAAMLRVAVDALNPVAGPSNAKGPSWDPQCP